MRELDGSLENVTVSDLEREAWKLSDGLTEYSRVALPDAEDVNSLVSLLAVSDDVTLLVCVFSRDSLTDLLKLCVDDSDTSLVIDALTVAENDGRWAVNDLDMLHDDDTSREADLETLQLSDSEGVSDTVTVWRFVADFSRLVEGEYVSGVTDGVHDIVTGDESDSDRLTLRSRDWDCDSEKVLD